MYYIFLASLHNRFPIFFDNTNLIILKCNERVSLIRTTSLFSKYKNKININILRCLTHFKCICVGLDKAIYHRWLWFFGIVVVLICLFLYGVCVCLCIHTCACVMCLCVLGGGDKRDQEKSQSLELHPGSLPAVCLRMHKQWAGSLGELLGQEDALPRGIWLA